MWKHRLHVMENDFSCKAKMYHRLKQTIRMKKNKKNSTNLLYVTNWIDNRRRLINWFNRNANCLISTVFGVKNILEKSIRLNCFIGQYKRKENHHSYSNNISHDNIAMKLLAQPLWVFFIISLEFCSECNGFVSQLWWHYSQKRRPIH